MSTFYNLFVKQCALKGVSLSRAAESIGLSRTSPNGWKKGKMPSDTTLAKLAMFFECSVDDLKEQKETPPTTDGVTLSEKKQALSAALDSMTDEQCEAVLKLLGE